MSIEYWNACTQCGEYEKRDEDCACGLNWEEVRIKHRYYTRGMTAVENEKVRNRRAIQLTLKIKKAASNES